MLKKNPAPAGFFFGDEWAAFHIRCAGVVDGVHCAKSNRQIKKELRWAAVLLVIVRSAIEGKRLLREYAIASVTRTSKEVLRGSRPMPDR
jgi:hypothetical protein